MKITSGQATVIMGIETAILGTSLRFFVDPTASFMAFFDPMLFWFCCGSIFHIIDSGSRKVLRTVLFVIIMNVPYCFEESVKLHNGGVFIIMTLGGIVMGMILGFASMKLDKKVSLN